MKSIKSAELAMKRETEMAGNKFANALSVAQKEEDLDPVVKYVSRAFADIYKNNSAGKAVR